MGTACLQRQEKFTTKSTKDTKNETQWDVERNDQLRDAAKLINWINYDIFWLLRALRVLRGERAF